MTCGAPSGGAPVGVNEAATARPSRESLLTATSGNLTDQEVAMPMTDFKVQPP
jgi:hypothetical protein